MITPILYGMYEMTRNQCLKHFDTIKSEGPHATSAFIKFTVCAVCILYRHLSTHCYITRFQTDPFRVLLNGILRSKTVLKEIIPRF